MTLKNVNIIESLNKNTKFCGDKLVLAKTKLVPANIVTSKDSP
jgi:hypothetical protein